MRWQLLGDWPLNGGLRLLPGGTIISNDGDPSALPLSAVPVPLPINALSLDPAAAEAMCHWYSEESTICGWHHLHFAHGIDHEAIKAKVRHAKRWPNGVPSTLDVKEEKPGPG
jgi:hypothetical protein